MRNHYSSESSTGQVIAACLIGTGEHWRNGFGLVFTTSFGTPLSSRNFTRSFHHLRKEAGLERMRFRDMRHTCASLLLTRGVPLRVVMEVLEHTQIALTANTYTHVIQPFVTDVANRLDDYSSVLFCVREERNNSCI